MMLVVPFEQYQSSYVVTTPASGFATNFVNVVVRTTSVGATTLDGVAIAPSMFSRVGNSEFSAAQVPVELGTHSFAGPEPFGLTVYGFDSFDSYGYPGGLSLAKVATVASLTLSPRTEAVVIGTEACVDAIVRDDGGSVVVDARVDLTVTGANPSRRSVTTNAAGVAHFCYPGTATGADAIEATLGNLSDSVTKTWRAPQPNRAPVAVDQLVTVAQDGAAAVVLTATDAGRRSAHVLGGGPAGSRCVDGYRCEPHLHACPWLFGP